MTDIHTVLGIAVLAANALAAGWGAVFWLRREPTAAFWRLLRLAQALVVAQVVLGFVLFARGLRAPDGLHLAYGLSPLFVTLMAEMMRLGVTQQELSDVDDPDALDQQERSALARRIVLREMGVMTTGALLVVTLALRALQTGGY